MTGSRHSGRSAPGLRPTDAAAALALLLATVTLASCGSDEPTTNGGEGTAAPTDEAGTREGQLGFDARLEPLNGSGAGGRATLSQLGSTLRVQTTLSGLAPGEEHVQHIHRLESGKPGECPPGDTGALTLQDALGAYGPVTLKLKPFPRADGRGRASFQGTFQLLPDLDPLDERVVAVYGMEVDGVYDRTVPVACGPIR